MGKWGHALWFSFPALCVLCVFYFLSTLHFFVFERETKRSVCVCVCVQQHVHSQARWASYWPFYRRGNDPCDYCRHQRFRMQDLVLVCEFVWASTCASTLWFIYWCLTRPTVLLRKYSHHDEYLCNRHTHEWTHTCIHTSCTCTYKHYDSIQTHTYTHRSPYTNAWFWWFAHWAVQWHIMHITMMLQSLLSPNSELWCDIVSIHRSYLLYRDEIFTLLVFL